MKIVVGASSFAANSDKAISLLRQRGMEVVLNPYGRKMTEEEIILHLQGAVGLLAGLEPLNDKVFESAPDLRAIARIGIGMDNVDQEAAKRRGIKVSNTPDGPTEAVAEMTLGACLALMHQILSANQDIHNGIWKKRMGISIVGAKVLLIGYGHIGQETARVFRSMGAEILIFDKYCRGVSTVTLKEGLQIADVISLHASGNNEIIGKEELDLMKAGAFVLNSARGNLVNEESLYEWLQTDKAGGYWGDAHWQEPYQGKIATCQKALLTPHISTYTKRCREKMELQAVENLLLDMK